MNGVEYYGALLGNATRIAAFERAIRESVRPGERVLDLGTGLGTYALFAARAGAQVWAVDRDPIVHVAESIAAENGLAHAVRFVRGTVPGADLPTDFDVLIFEDFPVALMNRTEFDLLVRVRADHLGPGARMVPCGARLHVAPLGSDDLRAQLFPGPSGSGDAFGLAWGTLEPLLANTPRRLAALDEWVLGGPIRGEVVTLMPPPTAGRLGVEGEWDAERAGRLDAIALWFDLEVAPGLWISNGPGPGAEAWGQWILPLCPSLDVASGTRVRVSVRREELPGGAPGWLTWDVEAGGVRRRGHEFGGLVVDPGELDGAAAVRDAMRGPSTGANTGGGGGPR